MCTSQWQKESTRWRGSWSWAANMDEDCRRIVECWENCSGLSYFYLEFYDRPFVVVEITVIGSWEDGDDCWKFLGTRPFVHLEPLSLSLMSPDNRKHLIPLKKSLGQLRTKKVRTTPHVISFNQSIAIASFTINRISPDKITEQPSFRNLPKSINFLDILQLSKYNLTDLS